MKAVLLSAATSFVLFPLASGYADQWADHASLKLFKGETVQQAARSVNGRTIVDRVTTCGTSSGGVPWQCRLIVYPDNEACLMLAFANDAGDGVVWRLANWTVESDCMADKP